MAYFYTCPKCGCNLDPGEKCDCQEEHKKNDKFLNSHIRADKSTGQYVFSFGYKKNYKTC